MYCVGCELSAKVRTAELTGPLGTRHLTPVITGPAVSLIHSLVKRCTICTYSQVLASTAVGWAAALLVLLPPDHWPPSESVIREVLHYLIRVIIATTRLQLHAYARTLRGALKNETVPHAFLAPKLLYSHQTVLPLIQVYYRLVSCRNER